MPQQEAGLCDDLAERGYVAVAPDTFDGAATSWIPRALVLAYPRVLAADATWGADAVADAVAWWALGGLDTCTGQNPARRVWNAPVRRAPASCS